MTIKTDVLVLKDGQLVAVPPRCAVPGCEIGIVDSDGGTVCVPCITKHCTCAPSKLKPYRVHRPNCALTKLLAETRPL